MPFTPRSAARRPVLALAAVAVLVVPALLSAQSRPAARPAARPTPRLAAPADVARRPTVQAAIAAIQRDNAWTLEQQVALCEIPAPPFKEARRAADFRARLVALGLADARIDAEGNVIATRAGRAAGPVVVLSAHLDTVFPESTDVRVRRDGARLRGPGIVDDCRGLAVLLSVVRAMQQQKVVTDGPVVFVGTVGEEGPGNLRGVRHLFAKELAGRIDYFISVDGSGFGITSRAVGSNRYRVTFAGPGGHSYGDFGVPNPMHAMGRAMAAIADLPVPASPRTTFNVGMVRGGTSVNSIAGEASMELDMRSESAAALASLDSAARRAIDAALAAEQRRWPQSSVRLTVRIDTIGIRPAGAQPDDAPIVAAARAAATAVGATPGRPGASSTDANVAIGLGVPGLTIDGGGRGDGSHSLGEWYEDGPDGYRGPQWALLLVATLAGTR
jgi:acetylornithine deacetylase/succinyl-diaminopimelate desuccinylase-like protein